MVSVRDEVVSYNGAVMVRSAADRRQVLFVLLFYFIFLKRDQCTVGLVASTTTPGRRYPVTKDCKLACQKIQVWSRVKRKKKETNKRKEKKDQKKQ